MGEEVGRDFIPVSCIFQYDSVSRGPPDAVKILPGEFVLKRLYTPGGKNISFAVVQS